VALDTRVGIVTALSFPVTKALAIKGMLCALWLVAVGAGFITLRSYGSTNGKAGRTPEKWPAQATMRQEKTRNTLMLFVHPRCPCTRASLGEFNRLLAKCNARVDAHVWFFRPRTVSTEWVKTDLWRKAAAIPGVNVHEDLEGYEARMFGAETSGYVVLYNMHGQLLFKGGITAGRGHEGDNAGEDSLIALAIGAEAKAKQTPVFGCSLLENCQGRWEWIQ
jgi:hypothetical protein